MEESKIEFTKLNEMDVNNTKLFWCNPSEGGDITEFQIRFIKTFGDLSNFFLD